MQRLSHRALAASTHTNLLLRVCSACVCVFAAGCGKTFLTDELGPALAAGALPGVTSVAIKAINSDRLKLAKWVLILAHILSCLVSLSFLVLLLRIVWRCAFQFVMVHGCKAV